MKVGDLVKWSDAVDQDIGVITHIDSHRYEVEIMWSGTLRVPAHYPIDHSCIKVINEVR